MDSQNIQQGTGGQSRRTRLQYEADYTNQSKVTFRVHLVRQQRVKNQCNICLENTITANRVCRFEDIHVACAICVKEMRDRKEDKCPSCHKEQTFADNQALLDRSLERELKVTPATCTVCKTEMDFGDVDKHVNAGCQGDSEPSREIFYRPSVQPAVQTSSQASSQASSQIAPARPAGQSRFTQPATAPGISSVGLRTGQWRLGAAGCSHSPSTEQANIPSVRIKGLNEELSRDIDSIDLVLLFDQLSEQERDSLSGYFGFEQWLSRDSPAILPESLARRLLLGDSRYARPCTLEAIATGLESIGLVDRALALRLQHLNPGCQPPEAVTACNYRLNDHDDWGEVYQYIDSLSLRLILRLSGALGIRMFRQGLNAVVLEKRWLDKDDSVRIVGEPCWNRLAHALDKINCQHLAGVVRQEHPCHVQAAVRQSEAVSTTVSTTAAAEPQPVDTGRTAGHLARVLTNIDHTALYLVFSSMLSEDLVTLGVNLGASRGIHYQELTDMNLICEKLICRLLESDRPLTWGEIIISLRDIGKTGLAADLEARTPVAGWVEPAGLTPGLRRVLSRSQLMDVLKELTIYGEINHICSLLGPVRGLTYKSLLSNGDHRRIADKLTSAVPPLRWAEVTWALRQMMINDVASSIEEKYR